MGNFLVSCLHLLKYASHQPPSERNGALLWLLCYLSLCTQWLVTGNEDFECSLYRCASEDSLFIPIALKLIDNGSCMILWTKIIFLWLWEIISIKVWWIHFRAAALELSVLECGQLAIRTYHMYNQPDIWPHFHLLFNKFAACLSLPYSIKTNQVYMIIDIHDQTIQPSLIHLQDCSYTLSFCLQPYMQSPSDECDMNNGPVYFANSSAAWLTFFLFSFPQRHHYLAPGAQYSTGPLILHRFRRPKTGVDKPFKCPFEGCKSSFYHNYSLTSHKKKKHNDPSTTAGTSPGTLEIGNYQDHDGNLDQSSLF